MKKGDLVVSAALILLVILLLFLLYPKLTGNVVVSGKYICSDSDGGKDIFAKGTVIQGNIEKGNDYCTSETRLKEYYCLTATSTNHQYYECPYKCEDGACVEKEEIKPVKEERVVNKNEEKSKESELSELNFLQKLLNTIKKLFS